MRGYNQAALLAQELGRIGAGVVAVDALRRTKATPSLGGLGRKARERALSGAIAIAPAWQQKIAGRDVLLVDDVVTSGATSERCTRVLLKAGAKSVRIASFTRVLSEIEWQAKTSMENETPEVR